MHPSDYYYNKFMQWQTKGNGDYRNYLMSIGNNQAERRDKLAREFKQDAALGQGFELVCQYLDIYAKGKERESIMTVLEGITNPSRDIID